MQKIALLLMLYFLILGNIHSQHPSFPGHSHNDYNRKTPFVQAADLAYKSIEVDVYPRKGKLTVSHLPFGLWRKPDIEKLYFEPIEKYLQGKEISNIILWIDIKSKPKQSLGILRTLLEKYKGMISNNCNGNKGSIQIILTGKIPYGSLTSEDLCIMDIDGSFDRDYEGKFEDQIPIISSSLKSLKRKQKDYYSLLGELVKKAHRNNQKVRIWGVPNKRKIWKKLLELNVDYINVDKILDFRNYYDNDY